MVSDISPGRPESIADFLELAERFSGGEIDEAGVSTEAGELPALTSERLEAIADYAAARSQSDPKGGWAAAWVADVTAERQQAVPFIRAKAAWCLGRAANRFFRPQWAGKALGRAREGFEALGETGWVAACDWQRHVLAWAQPDLNRSAAEVQGALQFFSTTNSSLAGFEDECRLTLAYIETLIGRYDEARRNLDLCEAAFEARQEGLGQVQCHSIRGNILRRETRFAEAAAELTAGVALAKSIPAPVEEVLAGVQLALVFSKWREWPNGYEGPEAGFLEAADRLQAMELSFWEAYCWDGLSGIFISSGRLSEALEALNKCRRVYEEFQVDAPLAGALIGSGWLETYRANYEQALDYLEEAEQLTGRVGNDFMLGISCMHLGELFLEMGRYQQSLRYLEKGFEIFSKLKAAARMAETGLRMGRCWVYLGRPEEALEVLEQVEVKARKAGQSNIFPYLYLRQAEAFSGAGKESETIEALQKAQSEAKRLDDRTGTALAQRLLGEGLCEAGRPAEAAEQLEAAEQTFNEVGLIIEQAACQIAWGSYHQKMGDRAAAGKALRKALSIGSDLAPDIVWQARAGLAAMAEEAGKLKDALGHYRQLVEALARLRQDMWQPALAGYFLKRPMSTLDRAVRLAVRAGSVKDVIDFIEASKAQVMANSFQRPIGVGAGEHSPELAELVADIRWRQERIRALAGDGGFLPSADVRKMRRELHELVKEFDALRGQYERKHQTAVHEVQSVGADFDLASFREAANRSFGENWLALDYYLIGGRMTCVVISRDGAEVKDSVYTGAAQLALGSVEFALTNGRWRQDDLAALGKWLLPEAVMERVNEETVLLVAPHRILHSLPWSALVYEERPLVSWAVPVVVPSLQSLMALMGRPERVAVPDKGLMLAVSEFQERHKPLRQTVKEVESLMRLYPESETLLEERSTWNNLLELAGETGLGGYSFFHIASHAFADQISGRLSGLALYDKDVWLDELWDCAPLPPLVTLSACSGSKSRIYEGDEQVGLATTCLAAGARHVVASLWPIVDGETAALMVTFYNSLLLGKGVASALAIAQREAFGSGKDTAHWAGFRCTGLPS